MQLGKSPRRGMAIGPPLLLARPLSPLAFAAFPNVGQLFQPDEALGMLIDDTSADLVIDSLLQPSLPSCNPHETSDC